MRRVGRIWLAPLLLTAAWASIAGAQGQKPAPLARYFPSEDLVAYVEFDGIDAHADAWKKTATSKIFNETPTGAMLDSVARQLGAAIKLQADQFPLPNYEEVAGIAHLLVRSGFAFAINRKPGDPAAKPSCVGLVVRDGAKGPLGPSFRKLLALNDAEVGEIQTIELGGRKARLSGAMDGLGVAWWDEGNDLAVAIMGGRHVEQMAAALDGKIPNAINHPLRKELLEPADGFEPVGLAFLDAKALPPLPAEALLLGLDGINRVDVRWGYRGEALESLARVVAPSPRKGVLALFDQPTFDSGTLPPRPQGVGSFMTASVDLAGSFDKLRNLARQADPVVGPMIDQAVQMIEAGIGRNLRDDVLSRLGPRVLLADVPTRVLVPTSPFDAMARGMARVPRLSLLVEIKDRPKLVEDLEALAKWVNSQLPLPEGEGGKPAPPLVRRLKGADFGYEIALSPTYWPLPAGYRPSLVIGERFLSLGTTPDVARQALKGGSEPDPAMARALTALPRDLTLVSVTDTKNTALPELLANVPSLIQWWAFAIQGVVNPPIKVVTSPEAVNIPVPPQTLAVPAPQVPAKLVFKDDAAVQPTAAPVSDEAPTAPTAPVAVTPANAPVPVATPAPVTPAPAPVASAPPAAVMPAPAPVGPAAPVVVRPSPSAPIIGANQDPAPAAAAPDLPTILIRLRLDPDDIPDPEQIRPYLFPATYAMAVDAQGFKFSSREAFPAWNPTGLAPLAIAAALPGLQERREAMTQGRAVANLDRIAEALEEYETMEGEFPPGATVDKDGKLLLSWRVELLPYLGERALYDEFHRDEPWDSPHNQALIARMPAVFADPNPQASPGLTCIRGLSGPIQGNRINSCASTSSFANDPSLAELAAPAAWSKPDEAIAVDFEVNPASSSRPSVSDVRESIRRRLGQAPPN